MNGNNFYTSDNLYVFKLNNIQERYFQEKNKEENVSLLI